MAKGGGICKRVGKQKPKERHAELVEASLPRRLPMLNEAAEMLRQAQHDVLYTVGAAFTQ